MRVGITEYGGYNTFIHHNPENKEQEYVFLINSWLQFNSSIIFCKR